MPKLVREKSKKIAHTVNVQNWMGGGGEGLDGGGGGIGLGFTHTAVKRGARAQFPPKLLLNKVLNFQIFSLSSPKLRQSLKS